MCLLLSLAPRSFLAGKSAKAVLRSTAAHFPSLTCVNLHHTAGWCDPVQVSKVDQRSLSSRQSRLLCVVHQSSARCLHAAMALSAASLSTLTILHWRLTVC